MTILEQMAPRHNEWVKMAKHFQKDQDKADELLQSVYLKIGEIDDNNPINIRTTLDNYVFSSLRMMNIDMGKKQNKEHLEFIDEIEVIEDDLIYEKEMFDEMFSNIESFMKSDYKNVSWMYKVGILKMNVFDGMSMQEIANAGGWTKRHVQLTIEGVRKQIKKMYGEKYEQYIKQLSEEKYGK